MYISYEFAILPPERRFFEVLVIFFISSSFLPFYVISLDLEMRLHAKNIVLGLRLAQCGLLYGQRLDQEKNLNFGVLPFLTLVSANIPETIHRIKIAAPQKMLNKIDISSWDYVFENEYS